MQNCRRYIYALFVLLFLCEAYFATFSKSCVVSTATQSRAIRDTGLEIYGDPGWIKKLSQRRLLRNKKVHGQPSLQAQQTDHFYLPVLLGSYSDYAGQISLRDFQNLLFDNNPTGTMADYFDQVSYSQFHITGKVLGWFTVDKPVSYYADVNYGGNYNYPHNAGGFARDVVAKADPVVDFSQFDNDGPDDIPNSGDDDGYVDAVMVVFAGRPGGWNNINNLRPLQWNLWDNEYITNDLSTDKRNIKIRVGTLVPELRGDISLKEVSPIGIPCHEFCHILGLPDLYDRTKKSQGLGKWCLMAQGAGAANGKIPSHLSAWCKILLGWVAPIELNENTFVSIEQVESKPQIYKVWEDGFQLSRYFLLENRQKVGFDMYLDGDGLLIYHVDENQWFGRFSKSYGSNNDNENHKLVDLEEADGENDLDNNKNMGDSGDPFPGTSNNQTFDNNSNPDSGDYDGLPTNVAIRSISASGPLITAKVTVRKPEGYALVYDKNGITGYGMVEEYPGELFWGGVLFSARDAGKLVALDVGFYLDDTEYEIKVYRAFSGSRPTDILETLSGKVVSVGWHTFPLTTEITLEEEQSFFISIRTNKGIYFDPFSELSGRSYISEGNELNFIPLRNAGYDNFNIRARIKTLDPIKFITCDFNVDGKIDLNDVISLLIYLRDNPGDLKADFNGDGNANMIDAITMLIAQKNGKCPDME